MGTGVYEALRQHNIVGLEVYDRLVFGQDTVVTCALDEINSTQKTVFLSSGHLHYSMGGGTSGEGFTYVIKEI
ncbi:unnamed protein product, partial [marine sediment metagenome]